MTRIQRPAVARSTGVEAPLPSAPPAPTPETTSVPSDSYATSTTATTLPAPSTQSPSTGGAFSLMAAQLQGGTASLEVDIQALKSRLAVARAPLPDLAEPGFEHALSTSLDRVQHALARGRISPTEAAQAVDQLGEMVDALVALHSGKATVSVSEELKHTAIPAYDVKTTTGDVLRITVRPEGFAGGQARVKMQPVMDDGQAIPSVQRVMVRFDLEGSETTASTLRACWDVEFGSERPPPGVELLDKRIHGIMLGDDGQPLINRGGRSIADHHFWQHMPDALHNRDGFKSAAQQLLDTLLPQATD